MNIRPTMQIAAQVSTDQPYTPTPAIDLGIGDAIHWSPAPGQDATAWRIVQAQHLIGRDGRGLIDLHVEPIGGRSEHRQHLALDADTTLVASQVERAAIASITLRRDEGLHQEIMERTVNSLALADDTARAWARTAPGPDQGAHKGRLEVRWDNGLSMVTSGFELRREDAGPDAAPVSEMLRGHLHYLTGHRLPWMSPEQHETIVRFLQSSGPTVQETIVEAGEILASCHIPHAGIARQMDILRTLAEDDPNNPVHVVLARSAAPFGSHTQRIRAEGWSVVNAPRPLPGALTWEGPFRHGVFYAAGDPLHLQREWSSLHAWRVMPLAEEAIDRALLHQARESGFPTLTDLYQGGLVTRSELERMYRIPALNSAVGPE